MKNKRVIELGDYQIFVKDELNYELQVYVEVFSPRQKEHRHKWKNIGYYGKLEHVLDAIIENKLLRSDEETKTLESIRIELKQIKKELLKEIEDESNKNNN